MRNSGGLTLVEVVLAILILAVGIIGAGALQANGLRATRTSQIVQDLDAEARSAIAALRHEYGAGSGAEGSADCPLSFAGDCVYEAVPCSVAGSELVCAAGSVAQAWAITVTAVNEGHSVVLNTLVMGETP